MAAVEAGRGTRLFGEFTSFGFDVRPHCSTHLSSEESLSIPSFSFLPARIGIYTPLSTHGFKPKFWRKRR